MTVEGEEIGEIVEVYELRPADLLEVQGPSKTHFIPFLASIVKEVDPETPGPWSSILPRASWTFEHSAMKINYRHDLSGVFRGSSLHQHSRAGEGKGVGGLPIW